MAQSLRELLVQKLQALYDIEKQLVEALPKMAEGSTEKDLKTAFEEHLKETEGQTERLKKIFEEMEETPKGLESNAIRGLIKDGEWCIANVDEGDSLDLCLIAAAQAVEHYEMAGYIAASEWATLLGEEKAAELLEKTLEEEEQAEMKLSEIGETIGERLAEEDE